jgi:hypothetical protein
MEKKERKSGLTTEGNKDDFLAWTSGNGSDTGQ